MREVFIYIKGVVASRNVTTYVN